MKQLNKLALLTSVFVLSLASCTNKARLECMESSDSPDYVSGKCLQVSRKNILEYIFIMNLPLNPEADPKEYQYDFEWNENLREEFITFEGGLKGKRMISFLKLDTHSLKLYIDGEPEDLKLTSGYVKISHFAITPLSERAKNANIYAYVAVGDEHALVDKPAQAQNE